MKKAQAAGAAAAAPAESSFEVKLASSERAAAAGKGYKNQAENLLALLRPMAIPMAMAMPMAVGRAK